MNFRLIPVFVFLLACGLSASALSIAAPQKIVAHSAWDVQVEFDFLDSFSTANVLLDGEKIMTLYSNNAVVLDPFNSQLVLKATSSDKKIFASLVGIGLGNHTVTVQTMDSSGAVLNSKDALVLAIEPLDSGIQSDLQSRIDSLKSGIDSLKQQLDSANQQNSALQQSLSKQDSRLEEQSKALSNLAALVELVRKNQSGSTSFSQTADQQLQELQQRVSELQEQAESDAGSSATGLTTAGSFSWSIASILGLLILVGIAGFTVYRHAQEKKIY